MTREVPRRTVSTLGVALVLLAGLSACGDGRPDFCDELARAADLNSLNIALTAGDLETAAQEAEELEQLANSAPADVREKFVVLAETVTDIVILMQAEAAAGPDLADPAAGETPFTTAADDVQSAADPAEVERRREELNRRLSTMNGTSSEVEDWSRRTCGLDLS